MLPHRHFQEQINVDDTFTRLLYSVIVTGLAPFSFYIVDRDGSRPRAHYDGLPVDYIATAITEIGGRLTPEFRRSTCQTNSMTASPLNVFVDWIVAAGYPVERVSDYDQWLSRFETKLRALPRSKRRRSSLPVLESLRRPRNPVSTMGSGHHFDEALKAVDISPETPGLTQNYINKCLNDMAA